MDFPEHYSETAIAVLSLPGWLYDGKTVDGHDDWSHDNGTVAIIEDDGTISTYPAED